MSVSAAINRGRLNLNLENTSFGTLAKTIAFRKKPDGFLGCLDRTDLAKLVLAN